MRNVGALKIVGALVVGGTAIAIGPFFGALGAPGTAPPSRFELSLAGQDVGFVKAFSPGAPDVVSAVNDTKYAQLKKSHGATVYPLTIEANANMSRSFFSMLRGQLDGASPRPDVAIRAYLADLSPVREYDFTQAAITEIDFPALDGSSREAGYITVSLVAEAASVKALTGSGSAYVSPGVPKNWMPQNFRLTIAGVHCERVSKISSISSTGSSFTVEFSAQDRASFEGWMKAGTAAVHTAQVDSKSEGVKDGDINYMSADFSTSMLDIKLTGLRVTALSPPTSDPKATATISFQHVTLVGGSLLN